MSDERTEWDHNCAGQEHVEMLLLFVAFFCVCKNELQQKATVTVAGNGE